MNVLLVSQCEKRALTESRRILDQFAERRGDRTWQTAITQAGLDTLRVMLKKTARKNTSVACHWVRGTDHSELLWIVGNASRFNEQGTVPTNTTGSDVLRTAHENSWHTLEDIRLLAAMAGLFHDFGKANVAFQTKLKSRVPKADAYRHEWVSLRLFESFVASDSDEGWLSRLAALDVPTTTLLLSRLLREDVDGARPPSPLRSNDGMGPIARAVGWLVVSHHRLLTPQDDFDRSATPATLRQLLNPVGSNWNSVSLNANASDKANCWAFERGTPLESKDWCRRASECAKAMLARPSFLHRGGELVEDPFVMHISRLALMLADHYYSSCPTQKRYGDAGFELFANTDRDGVLKQRLDEHLVGVAAHAGRVARALPRLERELPRIARCKAFQRRSADERFRWQDRAYDLAVAVRERTATGGFFGVNMASTGCGKTLANGRIMYALSEPHQGARFTVALGLRTLTLQTGDAYRERLNLGEDDMAVMVGGAAVRELHELGKTTNEAAISAARAPGSESAQDLLSQGDHVHFAGSLCDGPLKRWLAKEPKVLKLIQAPVLVCTVDHLMPATESARGGYQIAPMLRLMTSDIVLDEPDDFDLADLPALCRFVNWAGLLGSRVLLSSATLPPALVEALFDAYRSGRESFERNRGELNLNLRIPCAWFDEFKSEHSLCSNIASFSGQHNAFVDRRLEKLQAVPPRRIARIVQEPLKPTPDRAGRITREAVCESLAASLRRCMVELHAANRKTDPKAKAKVSFGIVRLANIEPLILVARQLFSEPLHDEHVLHLCVYHSRHPLLMRSAIEGMLDRTLKRHDESAVFDDVDVRRALEQHPAANHLFVVLASPVAEVGRDHDYDWAIVEPSSMRSIVQLAGRVRRHRRTACEAPNMLVLRKNVRAYREPGKAAFYWPGFEIRGDAELLLKSHDLTQLLTPEQVHPLDSSSRIRQRVDPKPRENLVDLEHCALRRALFEVSGSRTRLCAQHWWTTKAAFTGVLQRAFRFRRATGEEREFGLIPADADSEEVAFYERAEGRWEERPQGNLLHQVDLPRVAGVYPWGPSDYWAELKALCERTELDPITCAQRYGAVTLTDSIHGWTYHSLLGFGKVANDYRK